ncbi:MAG: M20/M25/M40 family metallo-hydrolase [Clostridiales bacterium]|nr:M20/M25/M40 family metallo-hydrolase [Clostridiales bacterium]
MKLIKEYNIELNYDLLFTAYSDEEYGGGNGTLAACLKYKCDDYLNLDCKNFEIWSSGVGGGEVMFEIKGLTPLDSCSDVIDGLVILKRKLLEFGKKREEELMKEEHYKDTKIPQTAARFMEARAGNHGSDLNCGHIIMTFYTSKTEPEIMAEFETMRTELDEELKSIGFRVSNIKMITRFFHFAQCDLDNYAMDTLIKSAREVSGRELTPCGACLSDLSLFIKYGSSKAFSFGIGRDFNEYGGAHQTDEFIECDNLLEFTKILAAFLLDY